MSMFNDEDTNGEYFYHENEATHNAMSAVWDPSVLQVRISVNGDRVHLPSPEVRELRDWLTEQLGEDRAQETETGCAEDAAEEADVRNAICPALVYVDSRGTQHVLDQGDTVTDPRENALLRALLDHAQPVWPHNLAAADPALPAPPRPWGSSPKDFA